MTAQDWATLIAAIAAALGLRELLPRLGGFITGSGARRRSEIDRMAAEVTAAHRRRVEADERADMEATNRRTIQEYAARLRQKYYEHGWVPEDYPEYENTIPRDQLPQEGKNYERD